MLRSLFGLSLLLALWVVPGCGAASDVTPGATEEQTAQGRELQQKQMEEQMQKMRQMQQQGGPRGARR